MATAKKKTAAKRSTKPTVKSNAKYAAKNQTATARTAAPKAAANTAAWTQKSASEWAKQSAKLYQLPFAQGDLNAASKQAAETFQSASDNAMKMGADMLQQFFGQAAPKADFKAAFVKGSFNPQDMFSFAKQLPNMGDLFGKLPQGADFFSKLPQGADLFSKLPDLSALFGKLPQGADFFSKLPQVNEFFAHLPKMPNFDPASVQDKFASFARESAEQLSKTTGSTGRALNEAVELGRENTEAVAEVANLAVTMSKEVTAEVIGYLNKVFSQNVDLSKQVMHCRTLNDVFDLIGKATKTNLDSFFSENVKLSEMLFQCATDVSEPLNDRISETTERLTKALAA